MESWLWIPSSFQFAVGSLAGSVPQNMWQPAIFPQQLQTFKNAHLAFVGVQMKAARGEMPSI